MKNKIFLTFTNYNNKVLPLIFTKIYHIKNMDLATTAPIDGFEYYNGTIYWNNFDAINSRTNKIISTYENIGWIEHFIKNYGKKNIAFSIRQNKKTQKRTS